VTLHIRHRRYWRSPTTGHLVELTGWRERVRVSFGVWAMAMLLRFKVVEFRED
jgi:hypothetical protein